jgi:hypothetical protein
VDSLPSEFNLGQAAEELKTIHEITRSSPKKALVRVIQGDFVDRLILFEHGASPFSAGCQVAGCRSKLKLEL